MHIVTPELGQVRSLATTISMAVEHELPEYGGYSNPSEALVAQKGNCIAFALRSAYHAFNLGVEHAGVLVVSTEMAAASHGLACISNGTGDAVIIDSVTKKVDNASKKVIQHARLSDEARVYETCFGGINPALELAKNAGRDEIAAIDATGVDDWSYLNTKTGRYSEVLVTGFFGEKARQIYEGYTTGSTNGSLELFRSLFNRYKSPQKVQ